MSPFRPLTHPVRRSLAAALAATVALALGACSDAAPTTQASTASAPDAAGAAGVPARAGEAPGTHRQYGTPVKLGEGRARSYVVLDRTGAPLELGVALDERALDGLPAPMAHDPGTPGGHVDMHEYLLPLPAQNPTPYQLIELDWNPAGHEPPGIYDKPHFDFHFYTISLAERNAIDPADPAYGAKAGNYPAPEYVLPGYVPPTVLAGGAPAEAVAVPRMGMHWLNPAASPELPPTLEPFTRTFIMGTWDGKQIFQEPMITRAFLLTKPDVEQPIPTAQRYAPAGYYPSGYRVTWDAQAKEYRVALTGMAWRD
ncbi:MAG TPA: DUF5602 domain-containing protein [Gemmatimonadales bacterium]|nr:DUF5602 domain-containing protein [Gemmatimonadales bacterium]